jgi:excisionase family DNA binding protein
MTHEQEEAVSRVGRSVRGAPGSSRSPQRSESIDDCVSVEDVAQTLKVNVRSVWTFLKDEDDPIPSFKLGRLRRIKKVELREWMERRREVMAPSKVTRIVHGVLKRHGIER